MAWESQRVERCSRWALILGIKPFAHQIVCFRGRIAPSPVGRLSSDEVKNVSCPPVSCFLDVPMQTQQNLCGSGLSAALIQQELLPFNWSICWKMWTSVVSGDLVHHVSASCQLWDKTGVVLTASATTQSHKKRPSRSPLAGCFYAPGCF